MKIEELADIIGVNLIIKRYANQNNRYTVKFERAEIKEHGMLVSECGNGETIQEAINDYVQKIRGKCLVINGGSDIRAEFDVPITLGEKTNEI